MAETLEFNDIYQEVKGSMVRRACAFDRGGEAKAEVEAEAEAGAEQTFYPFLRACLDQVATLKKESECHVLGVAPTKADSEKVHELQGLGV